VVGFIVSTVGLAVTFAGIQQTKADLFPNRPLPPGKAWGWLRARPPVRWIVGHPDVQVHAGVAIALADANANARGTVTRPRPADDADDATWRAYVTGRLDDLGSEVERIHQTDDNDRATAARDIAALRDEVHEVERRMVSRVGEAVGGPDGHGLDVQFYGLVLAFAGGAIALGGTLIH